jgi:hypothetical protein
MAAIVSGHRCSGSKPSAASAPTSGASHSGRASNLSAIRVSAAIAGACGGLHRATQGSRTETLVCGFLGCCVGLWLATPALGRGLIIRSLLAARHADCRRQNRGIETGRCRIFIAIAARAAIAIVLSLSRYTARLQAAVARTLTHKGIFRRLENRIGALARRFLTCFGRSGFLCTRLTIIAPLAFLAGLTLLTGLALFTRLTFLTRLPLITAVVNRLVEGWEITRRGEFALIFGFLATLLPTFLPRLALLFLALALIGYDAEIVVGELEEVFRLHAIAIEVSIVRQLAVFFQHLGRIAARPAVNPVELLAATAAVLTVVPPAAPAVVVTAIIVVQG